MSSDAAETVTGTVALPDRTTAPIPGWSTVPELTAAKLDDLVAVAEVLAGSDIIPRNYRGQPANIVAAALTGRSFGWDPLTAMRCGHVVEGVFTIRPEAMLALVRRAGHSVNGTTTPTAATVTGHRTDGDEMTIMWTIDDAARAGLCTIGDDGAARARSRDGKRLPWELYPASMLWARAVAQLCRMLFPDVTLGLSYTPDEMGVDVDADGSPITVTEVTPGRHRAAPPAPPPPVAMAGDATVAELRAAAVALAETDPAAGADLRDWLRATGQVLAPGRVAAAAVAVIIARIEHHAHQAGTTVAGEGDDGGGDPADALS